MYHTQLLLKLLPNDFLMCHTQLLFNSEFKKMPIHLIYRNLFIELERRNRDDNKLENIMEKNPICNGNMKCKIFSNKLNKNVYDIYEELFKT